MKHLIFFLSRPFSSPTISVCPCHTNTLASYTERHTFQDHFLENRDSIARDNKFVKQKDIMDKFEKIKL